MLAACIATLVAGPALAGSEFEFPDNQDISDKPGVFTGRDGGFVVTVWRDGRRTFGSEQPAPYGVTRDIGYGYGQQQPVVRRGVPQQGYAQQQPAPRRALQPAGPGPRQAVYDLPPRQPQYRPVYRPAPPKRHGVVADMATPE